MSTLSKVFVCLILASGCGDPDPDTDIVFVGLDDGEVLGGQQMTTIDPAFDVGTTHVDLFLDGDRIGADDFAPFQFDWNSTDHGEGRVELSARATLADGSSVGRSIEVVLDNTPPVLSSIPTRLERGDIVEVQVTDAHRIVSVSLSGPQGFAHSWDAPPYRLTWDTTCGGGDVSITAIDEASWRTTWTGHVDIFDLADDDCDGYESVESGEGNDCDDRDPEIHPGAIDEGPLGDRNCDGVAGTDADGDGIASALLGGLDCDDTDPEIHGGGTVYGRYPVDLEGEPVVWEPGTASAARMDDDEVAIAINRAGTLELVTAAPGRTTTRMTLVQGLNPGKVAMVASQSDLSIFYATGNEVRAHHRRDGVWTDEGVMLAGEQTGQPIAKGGFFLGEEFTTVVVARSGASVLLAFQLGQEWLTPVAVPEPTSIGAPIDVASYGSAAIVTYLVDSTLHQASVYASGATSVAVLQDVVGDPADLAGLCYDPYLVKVYYDAQGCLVTSDAPDEPLTPCWEGIDSLSCEDNYVFLQPTSTALARYDTYAASFVYLPIAADAIDGFQSAFATPGTFVESMRYVPPVDDPPEDGVDRDCDGLD